MEPNGMGSVEFQGRRQYKGGRLDRAHYTGLNGLDGLG